MSWENVAICVKCWVKQNPDRDPVTLRDKFRTPERCHFCGDPTKAGIYVRAEVKE